MAATFRRILQYTISLIIALGLLFLAFRGISLEELLNQFKKADYRWILLSITFAMISHLARARRWQQMLQPLGYSFPLFNSFLAVMTGYFMNLVIPRAGEVARCGILQKMNKVPISKAFGTVVVERVIDLLILLSLTLLVFVVEFKSLSKLFLGFFQSKVAFLEQLQTFVFVSLLVVLIFFSILFIYRNRIKQSKIYGKIRRILLNVWKGVISIKDVKNKTSFIFLTFVIWLMYYMMAYILFFAFPHTSGLDPWFGLIVLIMGALGMAAPVQGGVGTFHLMVGSVFALRGLSGEEGVLMATFMHTIQTVTMLILGGASMLIAMLLVKESKAVLLK